MQERARQDKEFDIDFKETLRKIENDRKVKLYFKNKELDEQERERKLQK